ncbi:hypothetical protein LINGRAHAP2_LOCUS30648 [Linum grandiflorum]
MKHKPSKHPIHKIIHESLKFKGYRRFEDMEAEG